MYSLIFLTIASLILTLILTPLVRNVFNRMGVFDHPDETRKLHTSPIPRVGGIAVALAYTLSFALLLMAHFTAGSIVINSLPLIEKLFPAALIIFTVGLLDDLIHLKAWQKLAGQLAAAFVAYYAGIRIYGLEGAHFPAWVSLPLTVFWLVGCCNAVNLIDGLDGLAAGVSLVATTTMLLGAAIGHNLELAIATLPLVGCLLGFLRYNFSPATVFLGDSGSLFIGFLLGCYGVLWSEKSTTILGMTAPLLALAIPWLDTGLAIARRFLRHQNIFEADRGHIHHRLLDRGFSTRGVALLLYGICALAAIFSLSIVNNQLLEVPVILVFGVATWLGIQRLGFVEFDTAGRLFIQGSFRKLISSNIHLKNFDNKLALASTPDECWAVVKTACAELGFSNIRMQIHHQVFTDLTTPPSPATGWRVDIPLSNGRIQMTRPFHHTGPTHALDPLIEILHRNIELKLNEFSTPVIPSTPELFQTAAGGK